MTLKALLQDYEIDPDALLEKEIGGLPGPTNDTLIRADLQPGQIEITIQVRGVIR